MKLLHTDPLHQLDLLFRESVEFINKAVDLVVRSSDLAVHRCLLVRGASLGNLNFGIMSTSQMLEVVNIKGEDHGGFAFSRCH